MLPRLKVLFLCTENSCRSQMAEGWARALHGDRLEPYSAGTAPGRVDPRAIQVMREVGVDISGHRSKHLEELLGVECDGVVTVCDNANESCPVFPGKVHRLHAGFDDPPRLAAGETVADLAKGREHRILEWLRDPEVGLIGVRK